MKQLLVTGGAGFIGSNFIHYILRTCPDIRVVNLDALTYAGNLSNLSDLINNPRYTFVKGDIRNRELVEELFRKFRFDTVVNFAAESHVDRSITEPEVFLTTNIIGTQVLLWRFGGNRPVYRIYSSFPEQSLLGLQSQRRYGDSCLL